MGFLKERIGKLVMIDASDSMLSKAEEKVKSYSNKVEVKHCSLLNIPYESNSFDAIAFIQVLHHLDVPEDAKEGKYPQLERAIFEAHRVLKANGVILIDTAFPEVVLGSLAQSLVPKTANCVKKRYVPLENLIDILESSSFQNIQYVIRPNCNIFPSEAFKDIAIYLDPDMKDFTSIQKLLRKNGEMEILQMAVKENKKNGTYEKFEENFFREKKKFGTHFTIYAQAGRKDHSAK